MKIETQRRESAAQVSHCKRNLMVVTGDDVHCSRNGRVTIASAASRVKAMVLSVNYTTHTSHPFSCGSYQASTDSNTFPIECSDRNSQIESMLAAFDGFAP